MNLRLLPTLSERAPATRVATVAITPLSCTIRVMAPRSLATVSKTKRLKYIFSTLHASCPTSPKMMRIIQLFLPKVVLFSIGVLPGLILIEKIKESLVELKDLIDYILVIHEVEGGVILLCIYLKNKAFVL